MNEAATFGDLGLRKHDFHDTNGLVQQLYIFSPIDIVLRLCSVKLSAPETDPVASTTCPTTPAMGHKNHDFRGFSKRVQDLRKLHFRRGGTPENHRTFANFVLHDSWSG